MQVYQKIIQFLENSGVAFQTMEHEPTPTSQDSARVRGEELANGAKAIVLKVQDGFFLFVMRADQRIDTKKVKSHFKELGKRAKKIRFASADELFELTGLVPGSIPPFGKPILDLDLFVDQQLLDRERIAFNAGALTHSVKMLAKDYKNIAEAGIFDFVV